jgi:adenylyl-sulfate kinase
LLVHPGNVPAGRTSLEAMVVWLDDTPLAVGRRYLLKHTARTVPAIVEKLAYVVDVNTLSRSPEAVLTQHDIGRLTIAASQPLFVDPYARIRATGSFILIDPDTQATAAAGMIIERGGPGRRVEGHRGRVVVPEASGVAAVERARRLGQRGVTVWLTGLSGSGKSTIANVLLVKLLEMGGRPVTILDGDVVRKHLSSELGFSKEHRDINIRRIGYVASEITKNGGIAICAPIAPYDQTRKDVRSMIEEGGGFILCHVATSLEECEARDRKGFYAKARAGIIKEFTGISDPYEEPADAELVIQTEELTAEEAAHEIILFLEREGYIGPESEEI